LMLIMVKQITHGSIPFQLGTEERNTLLAYLKVVHIEQ